jgi:hypothetical protein
MLDLTSMVNPTLWDPVPIALFTGSRIQHTYSIDLSL